MLEPESRVDQEGFSKTGIHDLGVASQLSESEETMPKFSISLLIQATFQSLEALERASLCVLSGFPTRLYWARLIV